MEAREAGHMEVHEGSGDSDKGVRWLDYYLALECDASSFHFQMAPQCWP